MKKIIFAAVVFSIVGYLVIAGCSKSGGSTGNGCINQPVNSDSSALLTYARNNGLSPVRDSTGLFYQVISSGFGATPNVNSTISVTYTGTRLDGVVFDSTGATARTFALANLIPGWQIGIPKIRAGGRIKLLVPSALGYGCLGISNFIPPNTPIYFDITLVSVQ
jgi:FKBP-type peptidyl-prolyl cis-trans isomerase FkpA